MFVGHLNISEKKKQTLEKSHSVSQRCFHWGATPALQQWLSELHVWATLPPKEGKLRHEAGEMNLLEPLQYVNSSLQCSQPAGSLGSRDSPWKTHHSQTGFPPPGQSITCQGAQPWSKLLSGVGAIKDTFSLSTKPTYNESGCKLAWLLASFNVSSPHTSRLCCSGLQAPHTSSASYTHTDTQMFPSTTKNTAAPFQCPGFGEPRLWLIGGIRQHVQCSSSLAKSRQSAAWLSAFCFAGR